MHPTQVLFRVDLFTDLSKKQLVNLASHGEESTCPEGEIVFHEGAEAKRLFVLLEGEVLIQTRITSRPDHITLVVINQPFQTFGWSALVSPHRYTASAHCSANSRLLALNGEKLLHELEKDPVAGFKVMRHIAEMISVRLRRCALALTGPLAHAVSSSDECFRT